MTHKHMMRMKTELRKGKDDVWRKVEVWKCKYCTFTSIKKGVKV